MNPDDRRHAQALRRLLGVMEDLRARCPWDRQQTLESLRHLTIEETYELSEAILAGDLAEIKKELGDLMMHIAFYAKLASEQNAFDLADVIEGVCDKLVSRHPHVYGETQAENGEVARQGWEVLKLQEGRRGVLDGVPASLPALIKALRIQEKVRGVGFDWDHRQAIWEKIQEELHEFREALEQGEAGGAASEEMEGEFGDLLFSLVNYARFLHINPETALEKTNRKFARRFAHLEQAACADGKAVQDLSLAQMDEYWTRAKRECG
jgi:XTP/dITP diphosphohydrolase